jgi:hypothetical protein
MKIKSFMFYKAGCRFWLHKTKEQIMEDMADMLRYDGAFCDPANPSLIAVPTYQGQLKHGATEARWNSFSIYLTQLPEMPLSFVDTAASWVTAKHPGGISMENLKFYTLEQVLAAKNNFDLK